MKLCIFNEIFILFFKETVRIFLLKQNIEAAEFINSVKVMIPLDV